MNRFLNLIPVVAILAISTNGFTDAMAQSQCPPNGKKDSKKEFFPSGEAMPENTILRNGSCTRENEKNKTDQCKTKNEKFPQAYNRSARIDCANAWDFDIMASFIYWNASENGMGLMASAPTSVVGGAVAYQNFGYNPGFKVGIEMASDFDDWTFDLNYTWLHQTEKQSNITTPTSWDQTSWFFSESIDADAGFNQLSSQWKLHYDLLDFLIGRPFYQGTKLVIIPNGGVRGLWIRQKENITISNGLDVVTSHNNSKQWSVGVVANLNSHWNICRGFRLDGILGTSLLYTRAYSLNHRETSTDPDFVIANTKSSHLQSLTPTLDLGLGLGYGVYTWNSKFYFDIAARYDFTLLWNQNFMGHLNDLLRFGDSETPDDLHLHGLTIDLVFGF